MADDVSTIQIGTAASPVDALLDIDNTTGTVSADVSLLSGTVQVPVTITTETLGANGAVTIAGTTADGTTVDIAFTEGSADATATTTTAGASIVNTEAAVAVCFGSGTLIRTSRGDIAVERLAVGDLVITVGGAPRPIRWLGHRTVDCRHHPRSRDVMPVRVAAHAFGENRPARDLLVSPAHSLCVEVVGEVLIPASALTNGTTITQEDVDQVTYWHVELEGGHSILLAENMPTESYLEMGNRAFFAESDVVALDATPDAPMRTHADFCRPFHMDGALVDVVRAQLTDRARRLGWRLENQGVHDIHLLVDGVRVDPLVRGFVARFPMPADARDVWFVSPTSIPAAVADWPDIRPLGACLSGLDVDDGFGASQAIAINDPRLCIGFHTVEGDGSSNWRWTAGRSRLPASLWAGLESDFCLRIKLARPMLPRWVPPATVAQGYTPPALTG